MCVCDVVSLPIPEFNHPRQIEGFHRERALGDKPATVAAECINHCLVVNISNAHGKIRSWTETRMKHAIYLMHHDLD